MKFYDKTVLPSGLRVVSETIPTVRSVAIGIWVGAGSGWESAANQGVSHLIEHMLFKGTSRRDARAIAQEIDGRGGSLNAFTSKEHTCYYARVLDEHLPMAFDVLADMITNSRLDPDDLATEKAVIAEEIRMYEDVPDEIVHDLFVATAWPDHPLGRPVLGTSASVLALPRQSLIDYMQTYYTPANIVVAVAGNVEHGRVVELARALSAALTAETSGAAPPAQPGPPAAPKAARAMLKPKDTEQVHLVLGCPGLPTEHEDMYSLQVINTILGGGATSRLFQEVRERRGLAYSIYSYTSPVRDAGLFAIYAGTGVATWRQVYSLIEDELDRAGACGLDADEVIQAREQLKGSLMLSMESTSGRMTRLGRGELVRGDVYSLDTLLAKIEQVTPDSVNDLCRRLFTHPGRVFTAVGPLEAEDPGLPAFAKASNA